MPKRIEKTALFSPENAKEAIISIRGQRVIIDADLAKLYGTNTKRLNEQVKRNRNRFPHDFMFQLTEEEKDELVANCDQLENLKYSSALPYAFTKHGTVMAANVLNNKVAKGFNEEELQAIRFAIHQLMQPTDETTKHPLGFKTK